MSGSFRGGLGGTGEYVVVRCGRRQGAPSRRRGRRRRAGGVLPSGGQRRAGVDGGDRRGGRPRRTGAVGAELTEWLRQRGVHTPAKLARSAVEAAASQTVRLPAEDIAAQLVAELAEEVMALGVRIKQIDERIEGRFRQHPAADVITSLPGIGVLLGAEFLVATGGDTAAFASADHLAGYAGLAPAPRDS